MNLDLLERLWISVQLLSHGCILCKYERVKSSPSQQARVEGSKASPKMVEKDREPLPRQDLEAKPENNASTLCVEFQLYLAMVSFERKPF